MIYNYDRQLLALEDNHVHIHSAECSHDLLWFVCLN